MISISVHPVDLEQIGRNLAELARATATEAEQQRKVDPQFVSLLRQSGVALCAVPKSVGGSNPAPTELLDLVRTVARADASAGWVTMIYVTSAVAAHWAPEEGLAEMFARGADTLLAGVVAPRGQATTTSDGFQLSGRWAFGSGAADADWIGLGAVIDDDSARTGIFYVPRKLVEILDTWDVVGLRASASHDLVVDAASVPNRRVSYLDGSPYTTESVARFPVYGLLAAGIAAVTIGVAEAALEEGIELAGGKTPTGSKRRLADRPVFQEAVARAQAGLESSWHYLAYVALGAATTATLAEKVRLRLAATAAVEASRHATDSIYTLAGGSSLYTRSPLQRYLRDIHTATQHMMIAQPTWELTGRVLLGIDTDPLGL
ncbi:MAG: acyl-CoA dehydrogenase family protein [Acidimicrobiia bacterium]